MDPNLDPELAMALRVSMQEERTRQEAAAASSDAAAPAAAESESFCVQGRLIFRSNIPILTSAVYLCNPCRRLQNCRLSNQTHSSGGLKA